ncbi:MAG: non-canonical purine NTP pyrophosphatase, partial [Candidatus Manganitrophaceae bacterium]
FLPTHRKTFAEISAEEKNRISHRGRAVRAAVPILKKAGS